MHRRSGDARSPGHGAAGSFAAPRAAHLPAFGRAVQPDRAQRQHFRTPAGFYAHTLVAYSYGKTLLSPGQCIGYLALPPALPDRDALRQAVLGLQIAAGWACPYAIMQYAVPELEQQPFDVARLEQRRDLMVEALTGMGYAVHRPEGTFYLFPRSPIPDDETFARLLAEQGNLVMSGTMFETPGYFRICLTATNETCLRSLPRFAAAYARATAAA